MGAIGAVFVLDASEAAAAGAYLPFNDTFYGCPALWVDRDTGAALTQAALTTPTVRLTLTADKRKTTSPSLVGVLPGESDEVMIVNTHTDGQNAFEENAAVTLVHLARHFSALPAGKRLKRSLVFSAVTGHMTQELPQTQGFIDDHPDLIAAAAAGMTIEHYGSSEWVDDATGFHATGDPEGCGLWTSESGVLQPVIDSLTTDDIPHTYVLRPKPLYLGIGGALYDAGVPGTSFIAGPNHLVNIVPNGHMDKLDAALAERQTRWTANLLTTFDGMTAADLMRGDVQATRPSLGPHKPFPTGPAARPRPRPTPACPARPSSAPTAPVRPASAARRAAARREGQAAQQREGRVPLLRRRLARTGQRDRGQGPGAPRDLDRPRRPSRAEEVPPAQARGPRPVPRQARRAHRPRRAQGQGALPRGGRQRHQPQRPLAAGSAAARGALAMRVLLRILCLTAVCLLGCAAHRVRVDYVAHVLERGGQPPLPPGGPGEREEAAAAVRLPARLQPVGRRCRQGDRLVAARAREGLCGGLPGAAERGLLGLVSHGQPASRRRASRRSSPGITNEVARQVGADRRRVYILGASAGAYMANIAAVSYPDVYAAVGILAGGPYSLGEDSVPDASGQETVAEMGPRARIVPVLVMQGTNDNVNPYAAGLAAVQQWLGADDLIDDGQPNGSVSRVPASEETHTATGTPDPGSAGTICDEPCLGGALGLQSYPFTVAHYEDARGRSVLDFWTVYGANHDYTGTTGGSFTDPTGPSMTRGAYAFLKAQRLKR